MLSRVVLAGAGRDGMSPCSLAVAGLSPRLLHARGVMIRMLGFG